MGIKGRDFVRLESPPHIDVSTKGENAQLAALREDIRSRRRDCCLNFFPPADVAADKPTGRRIGRNGQSIRANCRRCGAMALLGACTAAHVAFSETAGGEQLEGLFAESHETVARTRA